jgi:hypothetical protein
MLMYPRPYYAHEALKQELIRNPKILGLENIMHHKEEVPYTNGQRKLGQVDIIFWDLSGKPYIVEITTGRTDKARRRVKKQARTAKNYFKHSTSLSVIKTAEGLDITVY